MLKSLKLWPYGATEIWLLLFNFNTLISIDPES